jgi:hypothetical protein
MRAHREDLDVEPLYQLAFGKRPREELYHLPSDPSYMCNVAQDPMHAAVRASMEVGLSEASVCAHTPPGHLVESELSITDIHLSLGTKASSY